MNPRRDKFIEKLINQLDKKKASLEKKITQGFLSTQSPIGKALKVN